MATAEISYITISIVALRHLKCARKSAQLQHRRARTRAGNGTYGRIDRTPTYWLRRIGLTGCKLELLLPAILCDSSGGQRILSISDAMTKSQVCLSRPKASESSSFHKRRFYKLRFTLQTTAFIEIQRAPASRRSPISPKQHLSSKFRPVPKSAI